MYLATIACNFSSLYVLFFFLFSILFSLRFLFGIVLAFFYLFGSISHRKVEGVRGGADASRLS